MTRTRQSKRATGRPRRRGFALIVVITMMVLLSLLAVGLLSLSAIAIRSSDQGHAHAQARANARLALMMALGDLQKAAGPDQRITARADILDAGSANPHLTGAWDSWEIKATEPPAAADYESPAKTERFRGWLTSAAMPSDREDLGFAATVLDDAVDLMAAGTLGDQAPASDHVRGERVRVDTADAGALAWVVLDEGVKARVNTSFNDNLGSIGGRTAQLGTGKRPGTEFLSGLGDLERDQFRSGSPGFRVLEKGVSRLNFALAGESLAPGTSDNLASLGHDLTTHSLGLFTDTANGGLRQDFSLLAESAKLPPAYDSQGVYASLLGLEPGMNSSDPSWNSIHQFANLHRDGIINSGGTPLLKPTWPQGWEAMGRDRVGRLLDINLAPPGGLVLLPTMAKVQMLFTLVARDIYGYPGPAGAPIPNGSPTIHGPQGDYFRGTQYEYDLHLVYTPIVTLHNPYNVTLEFSQMRVEFANVPFAATVYRNGRPQNTGLAAFERMWADNENGNGNKVFGLNLKTKNRAGTVGAPTFRLLPGETKLFSPYIDPNRSWRQDLADRKFWDIFVGTGMTNQIDAIPGWRGDGIGFDLDWWNPSNVRISGPDKEQGRWAGCIGLSRRDQIHIEFAPLSEPKVSDNKFTVTMTATPRNPSKPVAVSVIEIDYETPDGLQRFLLGSGGTLRYPKEGTVGTLDMLDHSSTPIRDLARPKPFALMTVQAKTTSGGRDASNEDGRLATKPWAFAHAVIGASSQKLFEDHPANHSHEIDLQRLDNGTANLLQVDTQDRANFITGHTAFNGTKFGSLYDIPIHPLQSLATLNGANPGGSSGYLPRFAQPIGNSWAHPLLPPDSLSVPRGGTNHLDHSFLLNLALYDRFYFSGLSSRSGPFGDGNSSTRLAADFIEGAAQGDPRLIPHRPDRRDSREFSGIVGSNDAYRQVAAWQLMKGAFNINSTSVPAWKAMLASIHREGALINRIDSDKHD